MSLLRGIQSALFYYVSCAPCTKYTARKKRKKQIARDTKDRDALELGDPDVYRQPLPYRTNEFWASEIRSGPGPPPRNVTKKERENRRQAKRLEDLERNAGLGTTKVVSKAPDSVISDNILSVDGMKSMLRQALPTTERWRGKQREDEALWGSPSLESLPDLRRGPVYQGSGGASSTGFPGLAHSQTSTESFFIGRNPPINDLHPPVVSNPSINKAGNKWMLQPPPTSSVMNGFVSAEDSRSRSGSGGSATSWRRGGDVRLARQISQRLIREKLSRGELIPSPSSPPRSIQHEPTATSPNKQSSEESGLSSSTIIRYPLSKADPASSSSSTVVPGTSDSGVDVTVPLQIWSNSSNNVPGTSQQDFAFGRDIIGAKTIEPALPTAWPISQDKERFHPLTAPSSRTARSATVNLVEPARVYFIDGPRAAVSASTSPVKVKQRRGNPSVPQASSKMPIFQRRKEDMPVNPPLLPSQAEVESEEYFSSQSRNRIRTKTRKSTERISLDDSLAVDAGADADTEDEGGYDSIVETEIEKIRHTSKVHGSREAGIQGSLNHPDRRQRRRDHARDTEILSNASTTERGSEALETRKTPPIERSRLRRPRQSQARHKQQYNPPTSQAADFLTATNHNEMPSKDGNGDGDDGANIGGLGKPSEDDFGWVRVGRDGNGHEHGHGHGHTLLLRRWSVDF